MNITEDLGSVQHIFCDKTGTLTENSMVFRSFSINGYDYCHDAQTKMIKIITGLGDDSQMMTLSPKTRSRNLSTSGDSEIASSSNPKKSYHRRVLSDALSVSNQHIKVTNLFRGFHFLGTITVVNV